MASAFWIITDDDGAVVVAIAGNAAEALSAVRSALAGRMDLSVGISLGSSTQIALFAAPALVLMSRLTGHAPMNLLFSPIEITALVLAMAITGQIAGDGDSANHFGVVGRRQLAGTLIDD